MPSQAKPRTLPKKKKGYKMTRKKTTNEEKKNHRRMHSTSRKRKGRILKKSTKKGKNAKRSYNNKTPSRVGMTYRGRVKDRVSMLKQEYRKNPNSIPGYQVILKKYHNNKFPGLSKMEDYDAEGRLLTVGDTSYMIWWKNTNDIRGILFLDPSNVQKITNDLLSSGTSLTFTDVKKDPVSIQDKVTSETFFFKGVSSRIKQLPNISSTPQEADFQLFRPPDEIQYVDVDGKNTINKPAGEEMSNGKTQCENYLEARGGNEIEYEVNNNKYKMKWDRHGQTVRQWNRTDTNLQRIVRPSWKGVETLYNDRVPIIVTTGFGCPTESGRTGNDNLTTS